MMSWPSNVVGHVTFDYPWVLGYTLPIANNPWFPRYLASKMQTKSYSPVTFDSA